MNLERITDRATEYMVLSKLSDFSKQYLCVELETSVQQIDTKEKIYALNFKNIEQFKGLRPFFILKENQIVDNIVVNGIIGSYQVKLLGGDLVRYNGNKYVVLGIVVNTYAQWNLPTPLLFNPTDITNDYKALFNSKLTDIEINNRINDNFQAGKYDSDMIIPLVNANKFSDSIEVLEQRPTIEEINIQIARFKDEKDTKFTLTKDIFIDTVMRNRDPEISELRQNNYDLYANVRNMLVTVNDIINSKIEGANKKPFPKARAVKVGEPIEKETAKEVEKAEETDLSFLDEIDEVMDVSFLDDIDNII